MWNIQLQTLTRHTNYTRKWSHNIVYAEWGSPNTSHVCMRPSKMVSLFSKGAWRLLAPVMPSSKGTSKCGSQALLFYELFTGHWKHCFHFLLSMQHVQAGSLQSDRGFDCVLKILVSFTQSYTAVSWASLVGLWHKPQKLRLFLHTELKFRIICFVSLYDQQYYIPLRKIMTWGYTKVSGILRTSVPSAFLSWRSKVRWYVSTIVVSALKQMISMNMELSNY